VQIRKLGAHWRPMGKMRHVGVSNFKPHDFTLLQSALKNRILTNQIEISVTVPEALEHFHFL